MGTMYLQYIKRHFTFYCFFFTGHFQNVMKTRSGLTIKTVPSRRTNSKTNMRPPVPEQKQTTPPEVPKRNRMRRSKSMSSLSFVTRYYMLLDGTNLELAGDSIDSDEWIEDSTSNLLQEQWHQGDKSQEDTSHASFVGLPDGFDDCQVGSDAFDVRLKDLELSRKTSDGGLNNVKYSKKRTFSCVETNDEESPPRSNKIQFETGFIKGPRRVKICSAATMDTTPAKSIPIPSTSNDQGPKLSTPAIIGLSKTNTSNKITATLGLSAISSLTKKHLLTQAHFPNGQPILFNNIPVMVLSSGKAPVIPFQTSPASSGDHTNPFQKQSPAGSVRTQSDQQFQSPRKSPSMRMSSESQGVSQPLPRRITPSSEEEEVSKSFTIN